ncbi:HlyD family efflux transporter periplasmic adaptor subunit [Kitasatospora atroaurantiaca]|uniref:Macrolide-specific efflux system membrane fusion protein n=1 Tax=Kitasatospora atroaurantiaca TaxID=285545 RepID=A0A561ESX5_9ACTN|nr:biotin/lipoyl-binding protein [Kitasatospora atroaurantiaca]TWE18724.1 macrolide-specific efflux system membrane fusion protein [Kitasatospora atroaurantiaca]
MKVLPRRRGAVLVNSALAVALLSGAALAYTTLDSGTSSAAGKTQTRTASVTKGTVLATVSGSGTLSSPSDAGQDFVTGGKLTAVKVAVGDTVKKGQVLATVDTTAAQQQVDAAESALATAKANLAKAEAGETVTTSSTGTGSGSGTGRSGATPTPQTTTTTKVDDAQVAQAQQQVDTARTNLTNAEAALVGTTLTASVDGTVASVSGKVGDTVSGGTSSSSTSTGSKSTGSGSSSTSTSSSTLSGFVVLTNPTGMQVSASFSELDSLKLKKGEAATVTLNAQSDTKLNATVLSVSSLPTSSGGTSGAVQYGATLQITGDTGKLRTGLSATISVITGEADNALSVPTAALAGTGSSRTATLVHDDGSTERVSVTVGVEGDSTVQVVSGLKEGDKVQLTTTTAGTGNGFPSGNFPGVSGGLTGGGLGGGNGGGTGRTGNGGGGNR